MAKSMGTCGFCGRLYTKGGMGRHLAACKNREKANHLLLDAGRGSVRTATLFHIQIEGTYHPQYWMHIEIPADTTLDYLDIYLRDIWLECCGHLSAFTIKGEQYMSVVYEDYPEDKDMDKRLSKLLSPGMAFDHEYDFGTTTRLSLKVIGERESKIRGKVVQIMARNKPPAQACGVCGKPATQVCAMCIWGKGDQAWVCDECAPEHECGENMLLPVVNSPRVGMCGYIG